MDDDILKNSKMMRENPFFKKFISKHEKHLEKTFENLSCSMGPSIRLNEMLCNFLYENNFYRKENQSMFDDLKIKG